MEAKFRTAGEPEGRITGAIESQTARIPSSGYLAAAIASMATSAVFKMMGRDEWAMFVGQWAPTFLILGVYNKMVKQHGTDLYSKAA
jgi:Na+-transporting NADH:ubiquinone oxidoreductase subunit NqrB